MTTTMKRFWWFPALALLISCQRGTELKKTGYQAESSKSITNMVKKVNGSVRMAHSSYRGASGIRLTNGTFDLWGSRPWADQFLPSSVDEVSYLFFQMMQQLNSAMSNEQALAAGIRALNNVFYHQNPAMVVSNRYLDPSSLNGLAYLQAWSLPGQQFGQFIGNPNLTSPFFPFMNNGLFGDLPRF